MSRPQAGPAIIRTHRTGAHRSGDRPYDDGRRSNLRHNGAVKIRPSTLPPFPQLTLTTNRRVLLWQMVVMVILLAAAALSNTYTTLTNAARVGIHLPLWEPALWEGTSAICIALLIPIVGWWLTYFPLSPSGGLRSLPAHILATVPFSLAHVAGMVALRDLAYRLLGQHYDFGLWWPNWLYEYRKDFVTYWIIVLGIMGFRLYGLALESRTADAAPTPTPVPEGAPAEPPPERLVVRKRNREYVLSLCDIDRIDANGNYVTVHAQGDTYPRRESLAALERKLDPKRFVRVHRAHLVNVDRIREIQPWDHGDYRIVLHDGSCVNLSRRYRDRLQHVLR